MRSYLTAIDMAKVLRIKKETFRKQMPLFLRNYGISDIEKEIFKLKPEEDKKDDGYKIPRISAEILTLMLSTYKKNPFFKTKKAQDKIKFSEINKFYDDLIKGCEKLNPYNISHIPNLDCNNTLKTINCIEKFIDKFCMFLHLYFKKETLSSDFFDAFKDINSVLDKYINESIRNKCFISDNDKDGLSWYSSKIEENIKEKVSLDYIIARKYLYICESEKQSSLYNKYENQDYTSNLENDYIMEYIKEIASHCPDEDVRAAYLEHFTDKVNSSEPYSFNDSYIVENGYLENYLNSEDGIDDWFNRIRDYISNMLKNNLSYKPENQRNHTLSFFSMEDYYKSFIRDKYFKKYSELIKLNKTTQKDAEKLILDDLKRIVLQERAKIRETLSDPDYSISKVKEYLDLSFGKLFLESFRQNPYIKEKWLNSVDTSSDANKSKEKAKKETLCKPQ